MNSAAADTVAPVGMTELIPLTHSKKGLRVVRRGKHTACGENAPQHGVRGRFKGGTSGGTSGAAVYQVADLARARGRCLAHATVEPD